METLRTTYPFRIIATAIAFSPRIEEILFESKFLADMFGANLLLIHIGEKTPHKEASLKQLMDELSIDVNRTKIIWKKGDAVRTILEICKENAVDLLVLGAMKKESLLTYYIGSVARKISRRARCSVLLLTKPSDNPKSMKTIVVNGTEHPKTPNTIETAMYFAKVQKAKEIYVVKEKKLYGLASVVAEDEPEIETKEFKKSYAKEEKMQLKEMLKQTNISDTSGIEIITKILPGKAGHCSSKFARKIKADLLVVNSPDAEKGLGMRILKRIFPQDIEYVLEHLPANLLIVYSENDG